MAVEEPRHLTCYEYGHAAAFEYGQRFDARLGDLHNNAEAIGNAMGRYQDERI
jgi:hypothetical protein